MTDRGFTDFFQVKTREEVEKLIDETLMPLRGEVISLEESLGRILAENIIPETPLPPFSRSTVDGYAVRSRDTFGASEGFPTLLTVVGKIPIGTLPDGSLQSGQAMAIPTGGALPNGADAVVMVEHTESPEPSVVEVYRPVSPLENVIQAGEDVPAGKVALTKGSVIRPQEMGLLSALGVTQVRVTRSPVVGIISTGNEIISPEHSPGPGQIRDVNRFTLSGLVKRHGGIPRFIGLVPDTEDLLREACDEGLAGCDVVLLSGGSSVGIRDLTMKVLESYSDFELLVHGVSISPGKPTILSSVGGKMVFGLPGHPVSAWVVAQLLVSRAIAVLTGAAPDHALRWERARVSGNIPSAQGREDFIRARISGLGGDKTATPIFSKSGIISSLVEANALIRIPLNAEGVYKGQEVDILMLT